MQNPYFRSLQWPGHSFFLFGPRGVGKSTWLKSQCDFQVRIDLLHHEEYLQMSHSPQHLRAQLAHLPAHSWVCIDEIQKVPELLDEVHALIQDQKLNFALSGSSARKLKRGGANLLAGRAITLHMESLTSVELDDDFHVENACAFGLLPMVVCNPKKQKEILTSYVHTYLKEEIQAEGLVRNLGSFSRFLEIAGIMNAQAVNIENLARDAQVKRAVMQEYLSILEDTLLCHRLPSYRPKAKVREAAHDKWYWFDTGVARACAGLLAQPADTEWLGYALETLLFHELRVYNHTQGLGHKICYYKTPTGEIDFVIETQKSYREKKAHVLCLEVKWSERWKREWEQPIHALAQTDKVHVDRKIGIYRGTQRLTFDDFEIWPVAEFLKALWKGQIF